MLQFFLHQLFSRPVKGASTSPAVARCGGPLLVVERLEDRMVPSGYNVTLTSGSSTAVINDNNSPPGLSPTPTRRRMPSAPSTSPFAGYTISFGGSTNTPAAGGLALQTQNTLTVTADTTAVSPLVADVFANGYTLGAAPGTIPPGREQRDLEHFAPG